jgi:hypothetical protein
MPAPRFRPRLEALEDRALPSAYLVTNTNATGAGSLQAAVTTANTNPGSTISFAPNVTGTINLNSTLNISVNMEIDGPGAANLTLSGQNKIGVFSISAPNVTIDCLTIANGYASFGGGIFDFSGSLDLSRVTFQNNRASIEGGALFVEQDFVRVSDSLFTGNRVVAPFGYTDAVYGGAILSFGTEQLTVSNTAFGSNFVLGANGAAAGSAVNTTLGEAAGGAVACFDDFQDTFTSDSFTGNSARGGMGGVGGSGTYTIGDGRGGAIEVVGSPVEIDQSNFVSNVAQGGWGSDTIGSSASNGGRIGVGLGGAVENESSGQLTVNDSSFSGNRALGANSGFANTLTTSNEGLGGAIDNEGSGTFLAVAGSHFNSNAAAGGTSGLFASAGGRLGGNAFGGAINLGLGTSVDISAISSFAGNVALGGNGTGSAAGGVAEGGAIAALPTSLTISSSSFVNNRAHGGLGGAMGGNGGTAQGGALYNSGGVVTLLDLLFSSNRAIGGIGQGTGAMGGFADGGGLYLVVGIVSADNLTVQSNVAQGGTGLSGANGENSFGGGLVTNGNFSCTIADSMVTLNNAVGGIAAGGGAGGFGSGGGIWDSGPLDLTNTTVTGNSPDQAVP